MNVQTSFDIVGFIRNGLAKLQAMLWLTTTSPEAYAAQLDELNRRLAAEREAEAIEIDRRLADDIEADWYLMYLAWKRRAADALQDNDFDVSFAEYKELMAG